MFELHVKSTIDNYYKDKPIRLHMPGHKSNKKFKKGFCGFEKDVTEIDALDVSSAVKRAEEDVASLCGAPFCRMLVNGATGGIFSMLYAVSGFGKKIVINRSAHKSVYNALTVLGIEPIVVCDSDGKVTLEETVSALIKNPDAIGVFYTYPDYYGRTFDIKGIAKAVEDMGKVLLIDSAHGAHFSFSNTVEDAGKYASMWVASAHKSLATANQGAMVFCKQPFIELLDRAVNVFMTTSPSYPLLASIEYGVKFQASFGKDLIDNQILPRIRKIKEYANALNFSCYSFQDELKLILDLGKSGINAYSAEKILAKNKIYPEMNDGEKILLMFSAMNAKRDFRALKKAIKQISINAERLDTERKTEHIAERKIGYLDAKSSKYEMVRIEQANGRISACDFGVFPPCYPLVLSGEIITEENIERVLNAVQTFGIRDGVVKVVKEDER